MTTIALITGANKGIGFETARLLGARGATVLVRARDEEQGCRAEHALGEQGAGVSVHLATLGEDGPSGQLWGHLAASDVADAEGALPW